jgi:hypothetical protein
MTAERFEPTISAGERPQTHVLDREHGHWDWHKTHTYTHTHIYIYVYI